MGLIYNNRQPLFINNTKRYVLIFNKFTKYKLLSKSITEYDTLEEANEEIKLINELYRDDPRPKIISRSGDYIEYDFDNGGHLWGYVLLDFKEERILKWGNDCLYGDMYLKKCDKLFLKDYFFRKEDEIPKNYVFNVDEYHGWLIYRWNRNYYNSLFSLDKKPTKQKENPVEKINDSPLTDEEIIENDFDKEYDKYLLKKYEDRW